MAKLIGTAGHVDHGKTTLIKALTGIDADRLPEEKSRGMTIDIGFAFIDLPDVGRVSIVDVPGHVRFIANMLVGALGIDVALLCVAADEGVKPQTTEHLQVLELLPVDKMVVALTRADLADPETRELAQLEIAELLDPTRFKGSPVVEVSAVSGEGLQELLGELETALKSSAHSPSSAAGPWYLPIDRVFALRGHGCVVTGTLARGSVATGETAFIEPGHIETRIRSIHSHDQGLDRIDHGRRTALNLSGIKAEDIARGQAIGAPGALFETATIDGRVRWAGPHKHGQRVRLSIGSEEVIARMFLSDGEPDIVQLRLERSVACALDQPFIVRRYSPPDVLAGGLVIVPQATKRRKSERPALTGEAGRDPEAILSVLGDEPNGIATSEVCRALGKTPQQLGDAFEQLSQEGRIRGFAGIWFSANGFEIGSRRFLSALSDLHRQFPTLSAIPRDKVTSQAGLRWEGKPLDRILASLAASREVEVSGTSVRQAGFKIQLSEKQRQFLSRVEQRLEQAGINTPSEEDLARLLAVPPQAVAEILKLGVQAGEIVRISEGIYYTSTQIEGVKSSLRDLFGAKSFAASRFRDSVGTTRKYAIPLLEYLDSIRFTLRVGDERRLRE